MSDATLGQVQLNMNSRSSRGRAKLYTLDKHLQQDVGDSPSPPASGYSSSSTRDSPVLPKYVLAQRDLNSQRTISASGAPAKDDSSPGHGRFGGDAALELLRKKKTPLAAIFVHAGAGFHSHTNEHYHLEACAMAVLAGMNKMKQGGSAVDGVVEAIKSLEDNTITNAGVGSNLCMDGTVECDATVVDHNGRSGAVGAAPNIRNPIELAGKILEQSLLPLPLRRIPPVLLCGSGAREYAQRHGVPVVNNEHLVSENALDRFNRWTEELSKAPATVSPTPTQAAPSLVEEAAPQIVAHPDSMRDHVSAIMTGMVNEGQPDSPMHTPAPASLEAQPAELLRRRSSAATPASAISAASSGGHQGGSPSKRQRMLSPASANRRPSPPQPLQPARMQPPTTYLPSRPHAHPPRFDRSDDGEPDREDAQNTRPRDDEIYDTVGVIAIDAQGHIAAGSSSGGIGMKHPGRVGPAALVGVGTAVIPVDPGDKRQTTVAAVTSGTGEHMATSMASHRCAERLYLSTVRGADGSALPEADEDSVLASFIDHDFMAHPGVRTSDSRPAIGVMAVKKIDTGYYFYFGHNTESFALASMAANERSPKCVMSRMPEATANPTSRPFPCVMRGARKITL